MPQTKTAAQIYLDAVANSGLFECPKCKGLFATPRHRCYEDSFDAALHELTLRSNWSLSAVVASHTGYDYTVVLNRNVSGAQGKGRVAAGVSFASPTEALRNAIAEADRVDADATVQAEDDAHRQAMAEPEI